MSLALIEEMYHSTYQLIDPYLIIQKVSIYNILNFFFTNPLRFGRAAEE